MKKTLKFLKNLLNIYWLRPETALLLALQFDQLKNENLFKGKILDVGCGDGTFSFLLMGGQFNKRFDVYRSIKVAKKYYQGRDMFDYFKKSEYRPLIDKEPNRKIDVGLDISEAMIKKAKTLNLYSQLVKHDMALKFPFANEHFDTVFGFNSIMYSKNLEKTLQEINRVVKKDSRIFFFLASDTMKDYRIYNYYKKFNQKWAYFIDRGRKGYAGDVHLLSYEDCQRIFNKAGLSIKKHQYFMSKDCYHLWDIGFRVIFPMLKKMLDAVPNSRKPGVKEFWVGQEYKILSSYLDYELSLKHNDSCVFHYFVLTK